MNPPPPMFPATGSTTVSANATATAASTALPPRRRISTPTSLASGCPDTTIAWRLATGFARPVSGQPLAMSARLVVRAVAGHATGARPGDGAAGAAAPDGVGAGCGAGTLELAQAPSRAMVTTSGMRMRHIVYVDPSCGQRLTWGPPDIRSEEHTSELQSPCNLVCRLLLEKKKNKNIKQTK